MPKLQLAVLATLPALTLAANAVRNLSTDGNSYTRSEIVNQIL
jgi:hypothetical protein